MIRARPARNARLVALAAAAAIASGCAALRGASKPEATAIDVRRPSDGEWFGVYLGGRKIGASHISVRVELRDGVPVLVSRSEIAGVASGGNAVARTCCSDETVYDARPDGRLLRWRGPPASRRRSSAGSSTSASTTGSRRSTGASGSR